MAKIKINKNNVGTRITKLRLAKSWSQEDLASKAGVPTTTVSIYERGAEPVIDMEVIASLAEVFEVAANAILWSSGVMESIENQDRVVSKNPVDDVVFISSDLNYVHVMDFMGERYVVTSSKDIRPDRANDTPYARSIQDSEGREVTDMDIVEVLSKALGMHIRKIKAYKSQSLPILHQDVDESDNERAAGEDLES